MKVYHPLIAAVALAVVQTPSLAQTCEQATRNFNVSNGAMVRNQEMVQRAYVDMLSVCGEDPTRQQHRQMQAPAQQPQRTRIPPGSFVNCDQAGCWGASNSIRYSFVAGGNLAGSDGSFCARGAGNTYSCN